MNKRYWFKKKSTGLGWTPATWEGWAVVILYFVGVFSLGMMLPEGAGENENVRSFVFGLITLTVLLLIISFRFGEPINWRFWKKK